MAVVVISNVFRISAGERISQFGTLKCVGATSRQIIKSVLYESIFFIRTWHTDWNPCRTLPDKRRRWRDQSVPG
ncbi:MAG: FtsX-like permease family protein [Eisenbergiella massiliensis]